MGRRLETLSATSRYTAADEAGVELEGLIEEGGQMINQRIWQTTAAKKGQG